MDAVTSELWIRFKAWRLVRKVKAQQAFLAMVLDWTARDSGYRDWADFQEQERRRFSDDI